MTPAPLLLATTSRYRQELFRRLGLPFRAVAPAVEETAGPDETPAQLATRLAREKASDVAARFPGCVVIGSDQVAERDGHPLGKPGSIESACAQLAACSGKAVHFHTAICVVDARGDGPRVNADLDTTHVVFRDLDAAAIARYVEAERPLDCAGSFKVEGLGITLFERIESSDQTALVGLPLIALARLLRQAGIRLP